MKGIVSKTVAKKWLGVLLAGTLAVLMGTMALASEDDNSLASLGILTEGATVEPEIAYGTWEYNVTVPAGTTTLELDPLPVSESAHIADITGATLEEDGSGTVNITVEAGNGDQFTYVLHVLSEGEFLPTPGETETEAPPETEPPTEPATEPPTEPVTEDSRYVKVDKNTIQEAENTITNLKGEITKYRDTISLYTKIMYALIAVGVILLFVVINLILRKRDLKAELKEYRSLGYSTGKNAAKAQKKAEKAAAKSKGGPQPQQPMNAGTGYPGRNGQGGPQQPMNGQPVQPGTRSQGAPTFLGPQGSQQGLPQGVYGYSRPAQGKGQQQGMQAKAGSAMPQGSTIPGAQVQVASGQPQGTQPGTGSGQPQTNAASGMTDFYSGRGLDVMPQTSQKRERKLPAYEQSAVNTPAPQNAQGAQTVPGALNQQNVQNIPGPQNTTVPQNASIPQNAPRPQNASIPQNAPGPQNAAVSQNAPAGNPGTAQPPAPAGQTAVNSGAAAAQLSQKEIEARQKAAKEAEARAQKAAKDAEAAAVKAAKKAAKQAKAAKKEAQRNAKQQEAQAQQQKPQQTPQQNPQGTGTGMGSNAMKQPGQGMPSPQANRSKLADVEIDMIDL